MATFNSRSITIKLDSVDRLDYKNSWKFSEIETKFKADAYEAVINSVNTLKNDYDLSDDQIEYIVEKRAELTSLMADVIHILKKVKKVTK